MDDYDPPGKSTENRELTPVERTEFKSVLMKIRWPVARVIPELAYSVSALSQGEVYTMDRAYGLKKVLTRLKELKELHRAKITLRPIKLEKGHGGDFNGCFFCSRRR